MRAFPWFRHVLNQKLIIVILLLSIIPVVGFGMTMYVTGSHIVESEVSRSSQMAISQVKDQMDQLVSQVEQFSSQFALQSNVNDFVKIGITPSLGALPQTNALVSDISNFSNSIAGIHSVYLYHAAQQVVVSSWGITSMDQTVQLTDKGWLPALTQAFDQNKSSVWITPRLISDSTEHRKSVVTYMKLLPFFYSEMQAALIINIDAAYLANSVQAYPFGAQGMLLIFTEDHKLIAQGGGLGQLSPEEAQRVVQHKNVHDTKSTRFSFNHQPMYVTYEASKRNGWTYAMLIPADAPMRNVTLLKKIVILSTLVLCAVALLMSFFSYNRFQRGVRRIGKLLFGDVKSAREASDFPYGESIKQIQHRITGLLEEVDDVKAQWQKQLPLLRDHYLLSALFGNLHRVSSRIYSDLPVFGEPSFSLLLIEMDDPQDDARFSKSDERLFLFAVSNIANELMKGRIFGETVITHHHAAILLNVPAHVEEKEMLELAEAIRYAVETYLKQTVTIAIGRKVDTLQDVTISYNDAVKTMQANWLKQGNEIILYRQAAYPFNQTMRYPTSIEQTLLEKLRSGEDVEACEELERFATELEKENIALSLMKTYFIQLLVSVIRVLQEYDEDLEHVFGTRNPYADLVGMENVRMIQEWFRAEVIIPIIHFIRTLRRGRAKEIIAKTIEFIEQRYAQDLSLQLVADYFDFSPSYLSQLFKKEVGETFINYLIRYRVEQVKRLLKETELNITMIAEEVGYSNAQQLIRVFKKLEGVTPGEYREVGIK